MKNKRTRTMILGIVASTFILATPVFAETPKTTATTTPKTTDLKALQAMSSVPYGGYDPDIDMNFYTNTNNLTAWGLGSYQGKANIYSDYIGYGHITSGEKVRVLQCLLREAGYSVSVDGYFGSQTQNAVISFQRSHGLSADGVTGPNTWNTMIVNAGVFINSDS